MKHLFFILSAALVVSCGQSHSKNIIKMDSLPKPDTIVVAYVDQKEGYIISRALRTMAKVPKITDSDSKKWDWVIDTALTIEVNAMPIDTLRDSLKHVRYYPKSNIPMLRKVFSLNVHQPYPPYLWPLIPHK